MIINKFQHRNGIIYQATNKLKKGSCLGCVFYDDGKFLEGCLDNCEKEGCYEYIYNRILIDLEANHE